MALVELVAIKGQPVALVSLSGMNLNPEPDPPQIRIMLPTDSEGLFGRRCPACQSYFRTQHVVTTYCPYCPAQSSWREFFTDAQLEFIRKQHDAIVGAFHGPDGSTEVNFDVQNSELTRKDNWVYSEERQQTRFTCANDKCGMESDVLGEYVRCPNCGQRTTSTVVKRRLAELSADFEADALSIPKQEREQRQRRWRQYVPAIISEFEACGRDIAAALSLLPLTPSRRKAVETLSFQNPNTTATSLKEWFGFDMLHGLDDSEAAFVNRMFNRRHLFTHNAGRVDQEYLDKAGDATVRVNEVIRVDSKEVRRLLLLVDRMASNLVDGFASIS
jgi:hypothetical protein